ncbi:sigma 54-interacting transcriptional regulator [Pelosinus propionicus]|uniref:Transcriptional regulator containing PAS, AAA-type ATPase, and DNA-binding Fis domains n=1 Tax=Pelosinus propionicus DSM 13327 TaxID=1123291 RepID=A0A1I4NK71_9FIRM|nr:sigma 54-interacting transcriptional regulator [Pelosinus propionicus]SFM15942.1 Transcriptional regulator containing PAS, AAA-type ATPase, and DNA-binding Fis domains [Pelosinus propionicus DSM 13327]
MKKIAFLAPDEGKLTEIKSVLYDFHNEVIFEVGSLADGLLKAEKLIQHGIDIILARGETAFNIRDKYPDIVVVDIPITGFDLVQTLEKAKQFGDNVAVVSFPSMIKQIESLESALGVNIKKYYLSRREEVDRAIDDALKDGANVIIGGFTAKKATQKRSLPYVEFVTGQQVYLECFQTAKSILKSIEQQKRRAGLIKAVLNHAYEGILSIDEKCLISSINPVAQRILNLRANVGENINEVWQELRLDKVLLTGKEELNQFLKVNQIKILCNKVPIMDRGRIIGAVATFQDITKIQKMESRIRNEIYAKGHVAAYTFKDISFVDQVTKEVLDMAKNFAVAEANVLLNGETGTGKEVFAQSIHNFSNRAKGPFVAVNCAALPAQLLESELFGYVSGAFTGASKEGKSGLFEVAHTGTIFLDEIGEMDYINQGRLLRVLQERSVVRLGSTKVIPIDVRIIAATNKNLHDLVINHKFREDLYYRLNVLQLRIPPLRRRRRDIGNYAKMFLAEFADSSNTELKLSAEATKVLESYSWPGNIRELRNVMQRVVVLAKRKTISGVFLKKMLTIEEDDKQNPDELEEAIAIENALTKFKGNITEVAKFLNVSRSTLWRKMNKLGLKRQKQNS